MNRGREHLVNLSAGIFAICLIIGIIYGSYWTAKHVSYAWWYKDMVKQTIRETVNETALRK